MLNKTNRLEQPVLGCSNLHLRRGTKTVYPNLNVEFRRGITVLLGPNGAGKTTLLEALATPDTIITGQLSFNGERIDTPSAMRRYLGRSGYLPQAWSFFQGFNVSESLEYAAWLKGMSSAQSKPRISQLLADLELDDQSRTKVHKLSGGMRQRVGLAEAFVNNPAVTLLDEPTVGLDPAQRQGFRRFIRRRSNDCAIILSTHLTDDVTTVADRVLVVDRGKLWFDGSATELNLLAFEGSDATTVTEAGYLAVMSHARSDAQI